jgi:hypothetical protein
MQPIVHRVAVIFLTACVLSGLLVTSAQARGNQAEILPHEDTVVGLLSGLELRAEPFPVARGDWHESAGFAVPNEQDVVVHTLVTYVATLPTQSEARDFYQSRTRQLELDNEMTHAWNTPRDENLGADDSREFRIVYLDMASRARSAEYARLMRRGNIVGLVEVVGSPDKDDQGLVDEARRSIMLTVAQLLMSRMAQQPISPSNDALAPFSGVKEAQPRFTGAIRGPTVMLTARRD